MDLLKQKKSFRRSFINVMSATASLLASMRIEDSDSVIRKTLSIVGDYVKADRAYIFKYDFVKNTTSNTHEYCAKGITSEIDNLQDVPLENIGNWVNTHLANKPLYHPDIHRLDPRDHVRQILEPQGVKSLLTLPLIYDKKVYGFLGLDSVKKKHRYTRFEFNVLSEYSNLLINALQRIELDKKFREEKMKSELLVKSAYMGAWDWNLETDKIILNDVWAAIVGYRLEELGETDIDTWKKFTHPDDLAHAYEQINLVLQKKLDYYSAEFRMIHKDGSYVWVRDTGRVVEWDGDKPIRMIGAHIDINQIKNNELQLRVVNQAIAQSPNAIIITNSEGMIVYVNPKFEEMTGYQANELIGKNPKILKSGYHTHEFYDKLYETINQGKIWTGEFYNKKKDGTLYWEQASISGVIDENQMITHFIAIKVDVSERKQVEESLENRRRQLEDEVENKMREIIDSQQSTILALAKLTEARDKDTGNHVERVQYLCKALASSLRDNDKYKQEIDHKFIEDIYFASALHDIGKIDIPDRVLLKPGSLTKEEFDIIKEHVKIGDKILSDMVKFYPKSGLVVMGRQIAKYHHEKWDGSGYLYQAKGNEIPLAARIMAVVDVYDALRSKRPYKQEMTHEEAYSIILKDSGKHFDPDVVEAFVKISQQFDAIYNSLNE